MLIYMAKALDLTGHRFGRLVALKRINRPTMQTPWECRCDCGTVTVVLLCNLRAGRTTSCGCYHQEVRRACTRTHGLSHTREHRSWTHAIGRCFNPKNKSYPRYGGRGITMCPAWRNSFAAFLADMGPCPPDHSLNRIDNDGDYRPGNCEWATAVTQSNNRRTSHRIRLGDRTLTIAEAAAEFGIAYSALLARVQRGVPPAEAVQRSPKEHHD